MCRCVASRGHVDRRTTSTHMTMIAGILAVIDCGEQSVPRPNEGEVAPRDKRAAPILTHSGLRGGLTQCTPSRTILPGCSPQLAGSLLLNMPLHPEVSSDSTAALESRLSRHSILGTWSGRRPPVPVDQTRCRFEAHADPHKSKLPHALSKHAR